MNQRSAFRIAALIGLVVLLLLLASSVSASAKRGAGTTPQAQFIHASFPTQPLSLTADTGTLVTLTFTANQGGEIEVNSVENILYGGCCGGGSTIFATADCQIALDGAMIASRHHDYTYSADRDTSLTTTSPVTTGAHTLRLVCWGGPTDPMQPSTFTIESGGTGLIVATPATGN
jgi:hypothetical protein